MVKINFQNNITKANADTFNTLQDNVENYVDSKGINESGSETTGNYVKYDDGTMICYGKVSKQFASWSADGNIYFTSETTNISFPQEFISKPALNMQIDYDNSSFWEAWFGRAVWDSEKITYIEIFRPNTATTNLTFNFSYIAIGRWK